MLHEWTMEINWVEEGGNVAWVSVLDQVGNAVNLSSCEFCVLIALLHQLLQGIADLAPLGGASRRRHQPEDFFGRYTAFGAVMALEYFLELVARVERVDRGKAPVNSL